MAQPNYIVDNTPKLWSPPPVLSGHCWIFGRIGCLDEDTEIYSYEDNGRIIKKLKDLKESFYVLSHNKEKQINEIKLAVKIKRRKQKCYKITFEDGSYIIATAKHKFFTPNLRTIQVKDLKINDRLFKKI